MLLVYVLTSLFNYHTSKVNHYHYIAYFDSICQLAFIRAARTTYPLGRQMCVGQVEPCMAPICDGVEIGSAMFASGWQHAVYDKQLRIFVHADISKFGFRIISFNHAMCIIDNPVENLMLHSHLLWCNESKGDPKGKCADQAQQFSSR